MPGGSATYTATIGGINGFSGTVSLTVSGLPSGAAAAFSPASIIGLGSLTLTISTFSSIPEGTYPLSIAAISGSLTQSASATLVVQPAAVQSSPVSGTQVPMASFYNREGIVTDGSMFTTGLDTYGFAYSANLIGTTQIYNNLTFTIAPPNAPNVVSGGTTIALPPGTYSTLSFLGTGVNGQQTGQVFTVKYSDGTTSTFTQSMSDWDPATNYPGETTVLSMTYRDFWAATESTGPFALYGYSFTLNAAKTVASFTLPSNSKVIVVAVSLQPVTALQVPLASYYNREGIVTDGTTFNAGADGLGFAFSSNQLGMSLTSNGLTFTLGPANAVDVVSSNGEVVTLPAGQFSELNMLAVGVNGWQNSQTFTVTYTDGSTSVFTQSLDDWVSGGGQTGQTTVLTTPYRDVWDGTENPTPVAVYGYSFALDLSKIVSTVTLPNDSNVVVLGLSLVN